MSKKVFKVLLVLMALAAGVSWTKDAAGGRYDRTMAPTAEEYYKQSTEAKDPDQQILLLSKAIEAKPDYVKAYLYRAYIYGEEKKDYDLAIRDCDQVIKLDPKNAKAYSLLGAMYSLKENYYEALKNINKAILLNPNDIDAYHNRGVIYEEMGDQERARRDYEKAESLKAAAAPPPPTVALLPPRHWAAPPAVRKKPPPPAPPAAAPAPPPAPLAVEAETLPPPPPMPD